MAHVDVARFGERLVELPRKITDVVERVTELVRARDDVLPDLWRSFLVLSGGREAIGALLQGKGGPLPADLPIANYMRDAADALAGRLSAPPELRVDPPSRGRKDDRSESKRKAAEKRGRMVASYDTWAKVEKALPQVARWLPTAAYCVATIDPRTHGEIPYPRVTFHNPVDTAMAAWTPIQEPEDCGFVSRVPARELQRLYPEHAERIKAQGVLREGGAVLLGTGVRYGQGVAVVRYYDRHGTWVVAPDLGLVLSFRENPLRSGPAISAAISYGFSRIRGEFDDLIGLMISMSRIQIAAEAAVIDDIQQPTNLFLGGGRNQPLSGPYQRKRGKVNIFDLGDRVEIPQRSIQFQAWQQFDRLERQLNIEATIPVQERGESPMSFVTGRGLSHLAERVERKDREYRTILRHWLEEIDQKRLEYDERAWGQREKPMSGVWRGASFEETYRPRRDIAGNYQTRREYGAMAGLAEAVKLNALSIMDASGWVSKEWVRDNIDGLGRPPSEIKAQIEDETTLEVLFQTLMAESQQGDLRARMAMIEMLPEGRIKGILQKFYTPEGDEVSPEEEAMLGAAPPPEADAATVLSRLTGEGEPFGGVQTVRTT